MAADFKMILAPEITRITYIDGEPAAVALALAEPQRADPRPQRAASSPSVCPSCSGA